MLAALREELRDSNVRITALYAGATTTGLWDELAGNWDRAAMISVEEVAAAIDWALSLRPETVLEEVHLGPARGAL